MKKVASYISLLFLTSCLSTPGLKEPVVVYCTVIDGAVAECSTYGSDVKDDKSIIDLIGHSCISPKAEADIADHHEALHFKIKQLEKKCQN